MRAGDLLGLRVRDRDGVPVGRVVDLRLVQDGPPLGQFGAAFRVHGLVVSPVSLGSHLGYDRARVTRPRLLDLLVNWTQRRARYVEWPLVSSYGGNQVELSVPAAELPGVPEI